MPVFSWATMEALTRDVQQDDLLHRLQAGDDSALGDLADKYSARIYQLAFRYLRNKEDAEEVTQDVLFKVYRSIGTFRGDSALSSWIYRITFNTAMSRLRTVRYRCRRTANGTSRRATAKSRRAPRARPSTGATLLTSTCCARSFGSACSARSWRFPSSTARR